MTWNKISKGSSNFNKVEPEKGWFKTGWFKGGWFSERDTWSKVEKKDSNWTKVNK